MTTPANRWKLGLFVLTGLSLGVGGLGLLGARELRRPTHTVYAYFDEAVTGLEEGSTVKFRGVTIGRVERIRLAPDKKHLEVQAALYDDYLQDLGVASGNLQDVSGLLQRLRAQVVSSWVTNTAFVQVDYFPDPARGPQLLPFPVSQEFPTIRTVPSTAKSLEASAREVLAELPAVAAAARELVELLRTELRAARMPELSRQLQSVTKKVEAQLDGLGEDRKALRTMLAAWTELGRTIEREVLALQAEATGAQVRAAAAGIVGLRSDLTTELDQFHRSLRAFERLCELLERDPGSLLHGRGTQPSPLQDGRQEQRR